MIFINEISKLDSVPKAIWQDFVKILSPYAPHLGEELWHKLGNNESIAYVQWPVVNEDFAKDEEKTIVVMINGKLRGKFKAAPDSSDETLRSAAENNEDAKKFLEGKTIVKCVIVKDKLVNFVVK